MLLKCSDAKMLNGISKPINSALLVLLGTNGLIAGFLPGLDHPLECGVEKTER